MNEFLPEAIRPAMVHPPDFRTVTVDVPEQRSVHGVNDREPLQVPIGELQEYRPPDAVLLEEPSLVLFRHGILPSQGASFM